MISVNNEVEPFVLHALNAWETQHSEQVRYGVSMDFLPNPEVAEEDMVNNLVPALGIYLEIAGPNADTIVCTSFYFVPYLIDREEIQTTITKALDRLLAKREAVVDEPFDQLLPFETDV